MAIQPQEKTPLPSDPDPPKINEDWAPGDIAENPNGFEVKQQSKKSAADPCDPLREAREIAARRVYRDPCFRCQVRGDIGCEHQPRVE